MDKYIYLFSNEISMLETGSDRCNFCGFFITFWNSDTFRFSYYFTFQNLGLDCYDFCGFIITFQ
ncbi:3745_t:CDS:2, partial [Funneliformis geosporum]